MSTSEPSKRHYVFLRALILALLSALCLRPVSSNAEPPVGTDRFRWIEGLDDLYPPHQRRELSRPMLTRQVLGIQLHDSAFAVDFTRYTASAEMVTFLQQLQDDYRDLVQVDEIGRSWQDRPILAVRIGNQATGDPDSRPALYVDGGLHAREAVSSQAVLYFVWYLTSQYDIDPLVKHMLDTRTVYAIPCANPDGNDIFLDSDQTQRKTANPSVSDDDRDGWFDEDGREEAGYGTFEVYHFEFDAEWVTAHPDNPLVEEWAKHLVGYQFIGIFDGEGGEVLQVDDDGDGKAGEDPPGGVDPNRNFDSHWELGTDDPRAAIYRGPEAFSEPETRAVRDFVRARRNIVTASSFHSGSDILLHPWGWSAEAELPDAFWYEMLSRKGSQLTEAHGFRGAPHTWTARGLYPGSGSEMDWLYERGVLAWTPEVYGASSLSFVQRIGQTNTYEVHLSIGEAFNPPPVEIPFTVDRWLRWSLYLLAATPNVGLSSVDVRGNALVMKVANDGLLPLGVQVVTETEKGVQSRPVVLLSAAEKTWAAPLKPGLAAQTATITMVAANQFAVATGLRQVEVVRLEIEGESVRVLKGQLEPFMELGDSFGGWYAGPEWDSPEYHLGPPLRSPRPGGHVH